MLDFTGEAEKIGKATTSDVERGLMTLPVVYFLRDAPDAANWAQRLATPDETLADDLATAVRASSALDQCRQRASFHVAAAEAALAALPEGDGRTALAGLGAFIIARDH